MRTLALLYHDIIPKSRYELSGFQSPDANIYKLDEGEFGLHLRTIAAKTPGAPVRVDRVAAGSAPAVLLTFDDGGAGALRTAEMLAEYGWPGHFFVTTDWIGKRGFLTAAGIRELRDAGHTIGSHSCSHPLRMSCCGEAELRAEWSDSKRRLEDILGERVEIASVPGGYYRRRVAGAAAAAGIRRLFTSEPVMRVARVDGCEVFGRFGVQQGVSAEWVGAVLEGSGARRAARYVSWNGKKLLKIAGGPVWLAVRKQLLARRMLSS